MSTVVSFSSACGRDAEIDALADIVEENVVWIPALSRMTNGRRKETKKNREKVKQNVEKKENQRDSAEENKRTGTRTGSGRDFSSWESRDVSAAARKRQRFSDFLTSRTTAAESS